MQSEWSGVFTALVTPFRPDGSFDERAMQGLVERQVDAGVAGLVPCGTTGEGAALTPDEHQQVVATVVRTAAGRVRVVAGAGSNNESHALELSQRCHDAGADALLHVTPYYIKPTQHGLIRYYETLAEQVPLPIVLYNVPSRTGVCLARDTILHLAGHPGIVALKQAVPELDAFNAFVDELPDGFTVLSGEDALTLPMVAMGAEGVISVVSNVCPRGMCDLVLAAQNGDRELAIGLQQQLLPVMRAMFVESNPIPIKFALACLQLIENCLRSPLTPLSAEHHARLQALATRPEPQLQALPHRPHTPKWQRHDYDEAVHA